jgi:hypothetical protein
MGWPGHGWLLAGPAKTAHATDSARPL